MAVIVVIFWLSYHPSSWHASNFETAKDLFYLHSVVIGDDSEVSDFYNFSRSLLANVKLSWYANENHRTGVSSDSFLEF